MRIRSMTSKLFRFDSGFAFAVTGMLITMLIGSVPAASAHSFPEEQHPAAGQTIATPPTEITIKFDAPIEKLFAELEVLDAQGNNEAVGAPEISSDGITLTIKLAALKP